MLNFDFLEKGLEVNSPPNFMYDFSRKMFLMFYSINWPNSIVWLPLLLDILGYMCIAIVFFSGCGVINFEINFIFLIKPIFILPKSQDKNLNILRMKIAFKMRSKASVIIFKGLLVAKDCLRPASAPLMFLHLV